MNTFRNNKINKKRSKEIKQEKWKLNPLTLSPIRPQKFRINFSNMFRTYLIPMNGLKISRNKKNRFGKARLSMKPCLSQCLMVAVTLAKIKKNMESTQKLKCWCLRKKVMALGTIRESLMITTLSQPSEVTETPLPGTLNSLSPKEGQRHKSVKGWKLSQ